jgi:hypothetical protein
MNTKEQQIRVKLKAVIGVEPDSEVVKYMADPQTFDAWMQMIGAELAEEYRKLKRLRQQESESSRLEEAPPPNSSKRPSARDRRKERKPESEMRRKALCSALAVIADNQPSVVEFRQRILNDVLLQPDDLDEWFQHQTAKDGKRTIWFEAAIPEGHELVYDDKGFISFKPPLKASSKFPSRRSYYLKLEYQTSNGPRSRPTAWGGILDFLREISEELAELFPWTNAEAATFVLTGQPPEIATIKTTLKWRGEPATSRTRVLLDIDPMATPNSVMESYRSARDQFFEGRLRAQGDKHLRLAAFVKYRREGEKWPERMKAWNKENPKDAYRDARYFKRDTQRAINRLLNPVRRRRIK